MSRKQKILTYPIMKVNDKLLSITTVVSYIFNTDELHILYGLRYNNKYIRIKDSVNDKRCRLRSLNETLDVNEVKNNISKLIINDYTIKPKEIVQKTGYSIYLINRFYMAIKREVSRKSKNLIIN